MDSSDLRTRSTVSVEGIVQSITVGLCILSRGVSSVLSTTQGKSPSHSAGMDAVLSATNISALAGLLLVRFRPCSFSTRVASVPVSTCILRIADLMPVMIRKHQQPANTDQATEYLNNKLREAVTPLWKLSYEKQLDLKHLRNSSVLLNFTNELIKQEAAVGSTETLDRAKNNNGLCCHLERIKPSVSDQCFLQ